MTGETIGCEVVDGTLLEEGGERCLVSSSKWTMGIAMGAGGIGTVSGAVVSEDPPGMIGCFLFFEAGAAPARAIDG